MRTRLLIIPLFLSGVLLNAQTNLDSLFSIWQDQSQVDSNRVAAYKDYIWNAFIFSQPDTAFILANDLLNYATENNYPNAKSLGYQIQGLSYYFQGDYSKALDYYNKSLAIFEQLGNRRGIASLLNNMGLIHYEQGNYLKALDYYTQSLAIYDQLSDQSSIARSLNNIGLIYGNQGDYPKALDYYSKSLEIYNQLGNQSEMANPLNNMGIIYQEQSDYPKALDYYMQSLEIYRQLGNQRGIANTLNNMGIIYQEQVDYPKALDHYTQSLAIKKQLGDQRGIAHSLSSLGILYQAHDDYSKALDYHTQSLAIFRQLGDQRGIAYSLNSLGSLYQEQGDYSKALTHCHEAYELALAIEILKQQKDGCNCLYHVYKALDNGNKALVYLEKMQVINDSLKAQETIKQLERFEFQQEVTADSLARAEKVRLAEQKEKEILAAKKHKNRIQYRLVALVVLLLAAIVVSMTKVNFNPKVASALIFILFILIFEFLLVLLDPYVDVATDGEVGFKIGINSLIALVIFGIHQISERRLKQVLLKRIKES